MHSTAVSGVCNGILAFRSVWNREADTDRDADDGRIVCRYLCVAVPGLWDMRVLALACFSFAARALRQAHEIRRDQHR